MELANLYVVSRTFPESLPVINIPTHPCNHTKDSETFSSERIAIAAWFLVRDPCEKLGCPYYILVEQKSNMATYFELLKNVLITKVPPHIWHDKKGPDFQGVCA